MRKIFFLILSLFSIVSWSQNIEIGPLSSNPFLANKKSINKSNHGLDSSFIYFSDTLSLPLFDEFSSNKFQQYSTDYNAPGISNQLFYHLLDTLTNIPLPISKFYTDQQTFKRTYDVLTGVYTDSVFNSVSVKVCDLTSYPIDTNTLQLYPPFYIYDTIGISNDSDTIWVTNPPFVQDSINIFFMPISNSSKIWLDSYAYHNYRFASNPPSLGVVTFDGLDEYGYPYQIASAITDYADFLTSKPIDLSSTSVSDSVYLSFLYQPQGLGDEPEDGDSLILEFYNSSLDQWEHIWSVNGDSNQAFKSVHLPLINTAFFTNAFQFRFKNYGSLAGALDHFHIDYVHLRENSDFTDTIFKDFAFSYPLNSLLDTYTSVPWDHYKNSVQNKMTDSLFITLHNGSNTPENYQDVFKNGVLKGNFTLPGFNLANQNINYDPFSTILSYHDLSGGYEFEKNDPALFHEFEIVAKATAQFPNFSQNDSTAFAQKFQNYYSYDDGSAEAAFGPTGTQSRLAIKYDAYQADSLIGVSMHFVPSVNDVSNNLFLLTVWENQNGFPGNVLYEDDIFFPRQPIYKNGINLFHTYYFSDTIKVPVGSSFFVGWRQLDADRLNLGLDRNIDNSSFVNYSTDGGVNWFTSPFYGSAMIRPVFSTGLDNQLSTHNKLSSNLVFYPNPTDGLLTIKNLNKLYEVNVYHSTGTLLGVFSSSRIDLSSYSSGIYFIEIIGLSNKRYKIIKR